MKYPLRLLTVLTTKSPPSRGAWIEIHISTANGRNIRQSPPSRGAWIEMKIPLDRVKTNLSPPSRGAWIEIELYV